MLVFWVLVIVGLVFLIIGQVQATKNEKDGSTFEVNPS
jgi:hypothetical protein